jgi:hypothetical protein
MSLPNDGVTMGIVEISKKLLTDIGVQLDIHRSEKDILPILGQKDFRANSSTTF